MERFIKIIENFSLKQIEEYIRRIGFNSILEIESELKRLEDLYLLNQTAGEQTNKLYRIYLVIVCRYHAVSKESEPVVKHKIKESKKQEFYVVEAKPKKEKKSISAKLGLDLYFYLSIAYMAIICVIMTILNIVMVR